MTARPVRPAGGAAHWRSGWAIAVLAFAVGGAAAGDVDCLIEPRRSVEIRSAATGLIARVPVQRGDLVKAGQVLVEIDADLDKASAEVAGYRTRMAGARRMAEARVEFSDGKAARMADLSARNFISAQERDNALAEKRLADAGLEQAVEERQLAALEHRRLLEQLRLRTIRAPFDAVVTDRLMHQGELAGNGESARPILRLADLSVLHVEALLPVTAWDQVRIGQTVPVTPALPRATALPARVVAIDRVFDAASGTFGVRLELPNPALRTPAGIRCKAEFAGIAAPARAGVPRAP
jgi:RND family efflux transporter MFP subunit